MWGVKIRYLFSLGEEQPEHLVSRFHSLLTAPFLVVRGDVLRAGACRQFLDKVPQGKQAVVNARIGWQHAGMSLVRHWPVQLTGLGWPQVNSMRELASANEVQADAFSSLDTLAAFHRASLDLLDKVAERLNMPGRTIHNGLRVGRLSEMDPRSHVEGNVLVGSDTSIDRTATITGPSIIGDNCYLSANVSVSGSVVMPGTYVGENLAVENAIIAGSSLIRIDLGTEMAISDPVLLSDMETEVSAMLRQWPESAIAALLLVLSLPLWPVALLFSVLRNPGKPIVHEELISNLFEVGIEGKRRRLTNAVRFTSGIPLLDHLPMLWLVVRGHLRLFGSIPLSPAELQENLDSWDQRHRNPDAGLLGPAHLSLPQGAPEEELRLAEIEFNAKKGTARLFKRLVASASLIFSPRAWRNA
jgi:lipopolysaccharide/colanic/teichoic acid biosynthesis glycosyltransferase